MRRTPEFSSWLQRGTHYTPTYWFVREYTFVVGGAAFLRVMFSSACGDDTTERMGRGGCNFGARYPLSHQSVEGLGKIIPAKPATPIWPLLSPFLRLRLGRSLFRAGRIFATERNFAAFGAARNAAEDVTAARQQ